MTTPPGDRWWMILNAVLIMTLAGYLGWLVFDLVRTHPGRRVANITPPAATAAPAPKKPPTPSAPKAMAIPAVTPPAPTPLPTPPPIAQAPEQQPAAPTTVSTPATPSAASASMAAAPAPPPPPVVGTPPAPEMPLRLLGIVSGEKTEAIVEDTQTKQLYFLHVGDTVHHLTVQSITEEQLVLHGEQGDITLSL